MTSTAQIPVDELTQDDAAAELARLAKELAEHDYRYNTEDAPTISDADYDALKRRNAEIEARYPELNAHKRDHERLLDDLRDIMDSEAATEADARSNALGTALDAWFGVHFATFDARLHAMPSTRR